MLELQALLLRSVPHHTALDRSAPLCIAGARSHSDELTDLPRARVKGAAFGAEFRLRSVGVYVHLPIA